MIYPQVQTGRDLASMPSHYIMPQDYTLRTFYHLLSTLFHSEDLVVTEKVKLPQAAKGFNIDALSHTYRYYSRFLVGFVWCWLCCYFGVFQDEAMHNQAVLQAPQNG